MLTAKILLILSFIYRTYKHINGDAKIEDESGKIAARLATASIFISTIILYYFAGIFNLIG